MKMSTYEEFLVGYKKLIRAMLSYTLEQVGARVYAEKLGELADNNPQEWAEMADEELGDDHGCQL